CSSDNGADHFVGKWVEEGKDLSEPIEIKRENDHLFLLMKNNNETMEIPSTYDKEQKKLNAKISKGGKSIDIQAIYLSDSKKIKINMMGKSAELFKISNDEAAE